MSGFNPFKNWPFPATPGPAKLTKSTCECDSKHFHLNGHSCPASHLDAELTQGSPTPLGQRLMPNARGRAEPQREKTTAIDALKAVKAQKVLKMQPAAPGKENIGPTTIRKEAELVKQPSAETKPTHGILKISNCNHQNTPSNTGSPLASHSVLVSTAAVTMSGSSRGTSSSGGNTNDTQIITSSTGSSAEGTTGGERGKSKTVTIESPFAQSKRVASAPQTKSTQAFKGAGRSTPLSSLEKWPVPGLGKVVLGCSTCFFSPRLRAVPCGCLTCYECGGRFYANASIGANVFCGCGDVVTSLMHSQESPNSTLPLPGLYAHKYPPSSHTTSPASVSSTAAAAAAAAAAVQFSSPVPNHLAYSSWKADSSAIAMSQLSTSATTRGTPTVSVPAAGTMTSIFGADAPVFPGAPITLPAIPNVANATSILTDVDAAIQNAPFVELGRNSLAQNWPCVKIGNIPYNVTSEELAEFIGKNSGIVPEVAGSIGIHVIMDRSTGKTMDAYAEFASAKDAWKCVSRRRSRVLGNRHLTLEVVDPSELQKDIFPRAKGIVWDGVVPRPCAKDSEFGSKIEVISREELVLIVNHARTPHRSPFSRKCLQRPFQSLMSIVSKFPWFAIHLYTIQQRDYIFHAVLSAIDILKRQIKRGKTSPNLSVELLKSLLHVGLRCGGFTDAQKYELVKMAEFGADDIQVDADIRVLSGFEALGKVVGAERKALEFYALVLELSVSPFLSGSSAQGLAAAELIRAKSVNRQQPEDSKKSHLTMAEAAALEWATIDKAIRAVLPIAMNAPAIAPAIKL